MGDNPPVRKHVRRACRACQKQKTKCSGEQPACARCVRLKRVCEYAPPPPAWPQHDGAAAEISPAELAHQVASLTAELRAMKALLMERNVLPLDSDPVPVGDGHEPPPAPASAVSRSDSEHSPIMPERDLSDADKRAMVDLFFDTFNQITPFVDASLKGSATVLNPQNDVETVLHLSILGVMLRLDGLFAQCDVRLAAARKVATGVIDAPASRLLVSATLLLCGAYSITGEFQKMQTFAAIAFQKGESIGLAPPDPLHITTMMMRRFSSDARDMELKQAQRTGPSPPVPDHPIFFGVIPTVDIFRDMNVGLASLAARPNAGAWECSYWLQSALGAVHTVLFSSQRQELSPEFAETLLTTLDLIASLTTKHEVAKLMNVVLISCLQVVIAHIMFVLRRHEDAIAQIGVFVDLFRQNGGVIRYASPQPFFAMVHASNILVQCGAVAQLREIRHLLEPHARVWVMIAPALGWIDHHLGLLEQHEVDEAVMMMGDPSLYDEIRQI